MFAIIKTFAAFFGEPKNQVIAILIGLVGWLGYMTVRGEIDTEIDMASDEKHQHIIELEKEITDLNFKFKEIEKYAAKGVWTAINKNSTDIAVLKETKRDKK